MRPRSRAFNFGLYSKPRKGPTTTSCSAAHSPLGSPLSISRSSSRQSTQEHQKAPQTSHTKRFALLSVTATAGQRETPRVYWFHYKHCPNLALKDPSWIPLVDRLEDRIRLEMP